MALAKAAGVKLKEITGWYENSISPVPTYAADYATGKGGLGGGGAVATPDTPAGSQEVVIEIGVNYNVK